MARLLVKSNGFQNQVLELKLGLNRIGRSPENDFVIEHPTISAQHCEIVLSNDHVLLRDKNSTNGTFVTGEPVKEVRLEAGQTVHLGDVELFVDETEVNIAIPKLDLPVETPPLVLSDGSVLCPRHPHARATHRCTGCNEVLCDSCVHRLRRRGGKLLKLCSLCSHAVEPLAPQKKKKKTLLGLLRETVKLPFLRHTPRE
jgi:pSer/pThr/pTyr-binding forkhead associated (FHA) protein